MINTDVKIQSGGYEAKFLSGMGGNCYSLIHIETGADILRTPETDEELNLEMYLYGNPILFPPNRIRGGKFTFEGKEYTLPVNELATNCHIHGALYQTPFHVERLEKNLVEFSYSAQEGEYLNLPIAFTLKREYTLSENGLKEKITIINNSERNLPFMLAFHTTFQLPFIKSGKMEDYRLELPVGKEEVRDKNYLPTGEWRKNSIREWEMNSGTFILDRKAISAFYEAKGEMRLTDIKNKLTVCYFGDQNYLYRMVWKKENSNFLVVEPQTSAIDCFHLKKPAEEYGLQIIKPTENKSFCTWIKIQKN